MGVRPVGSPSTQRGLCAQPRAPMSAASARAAAAGSRRCERACHQRSTWSALCTAAGSRRRAPPRARARRRRRAGSASSGLDLARGATSASRRAQVVRERRHDPEDAAGQKNVNASPRISSRAATDARRQRRAHRRRARGFASPPRRRDPRARWTIGPSAATFARGTSRS